VIDSIESPESACRPPSKGSFIFHLIVQIAIIIYVPRMINLHYSHKFDLFWRNIIEQRIPVFYCSHSTLSTENYDDRHVIITQT